MGDAARLGQGLKTDARAEEHGRKALATSLGRTAFSHAANWPISPGQFAAARLQASVRGA
jgi:hypothetical protein